MRFKTILLQTALVTFLFSAAGCFSSNPKDIEAFVKPHKVNVASEGYILQPPDEIEIYCSKVPEVHMQRQRIRPDGKVAFEALGEIDAAGKTPKELAEALREKILMLYALTNENPIEVRIMVYKSKVYYVLGEVYYPGAKDATGRDTALTAISEARPTVLAWLNRIQIIRPSDDEKVKAKIFELNFDRMSAHGETSKNVLLKEGDIIYVPPTVLAAIGKKVEELLSPVGRAFSTVNIVQGAPTPR